MISVIIPTLNSEDRLGRTFSSLIPAVVAGVVKEVIVVDGGSIDKTSRIADVAGAEFIVVPRGRGNQLAAGAEAARGNWLLFLHDDTALDPGWEREADSFISRAARNERGGDGSAAAFRFALDDFGFMPRFLEWGVRIRCALLGLPYGDQGLLISKRLYRELGGFKSLPLMEDVDIIRRLGRRRLTMLRSCAVTSATRFKRDGYFVRIARNLSCLALYYLRVPPRYIARIYG